MTLRHLPNRIAPRSKLVAMKGKVRIVIIASSPPCDKCAACKRMAQELSERYGPEVEYQILDAMDPAADAYGVLMTPTMIVGDMVVSVGRAPRKEALDGLVQGLLADEGQGCTA